MEPYILLSNGLEYWYNKPVPAEIEIENIAASLSKQCRFSGHVSRFYSVAEHSWRASYIVPEEDALEALMHDAAECYVVDIPSPLKPLLTDYARIEDLAHVAIAERFSLRYPWPKSVKVADMVMLATEKRDLLPDAGKPWPHLAGIEPLDAAIPDEVNWGNPVRWEMRFLDRFEQLMAYRRRLEVV